MKKYKVTNGTSVLGPFDGAEKAAHTLISVVCDSLNDGADPTKWRIEETGDEEPGEEKPKDVPDLSSRHIYFRTEKRANQFAEKFIDLFREALK